MRPKQINIWEERVSQVTEIIELEYKNLFVIHGDKENQNGRFQTESVGFQRDMTSGAAKEKLI